MKRAVDLKCTKEPSQVVQDLNEFKAVFSQAYKNWTNSEHEVHNFTVY